jgi:hypothetical protein
LLTVPVRLIVLPSAPVTVRERVQVPSPQLAERWLVRVPRAVLVALERSQADACPMPASSRTPASADAAKCLIIECYLTRGDDRAPMPEMADSFDPSRCARLSGNHLSLEDL